MYMLIIDGFVQALPRYNIYLYSFHLFLFFNASEGLLFLTRGEIRQRQGLRFDILNKELAFFIPFWGTD